MTLMEIETKPETQPGFTGGGDHEKLAHYVRKAQITDATVFGTPVTALCGKTWVPTRDPKRFPVCPDCQGILDGAFPVVSE